MNITDYIQCEQEGDNTFWYRGGRPVSWVISNHYESRSNPLRLAIIMRVPRRIRKAEKEKRKAWKKKGGHSNKADVEEPADMKARRSGLGSKCQMDVGTWP